MLLIDNTIIGAITMFSNLTKFEVSRTSQEAVGFYIAYLFLGLASGFVIGAVAGILNPENAQQAAFQAGSVFAIVVCLTLAISISLKKGLFSSFKAIVVIAITAVLSLLLGMLGGLLPVAYLTTLEKEAVSS